MTTVSLDTVRINVKTLYDTNPVIHMDISLSHPKLVLKNAIATIKNVYPHTFQIEENTSGSVKIHTIQYTDVLINNVTILELNDLN